jgi:hypothetical protein
MIVTMGSKVFEKLVSSKTEMKVDEEYEIFYSFLKYVYSGKITLTDENVRKLLDVSIRYRITDLKDECYNFLLKGMDMDEFGEIFVSEKKRRRETTDDETTVLDKSPPHKKIMTKESENTYLKKRSHDEMEIDDMEHVSKKQKTDVSISDEFFMKCMEHMSKYEDVVSFTQFKQLDETRLLKLIQSDNFCVDELDLFKAILEWGKQRCKDQEKHSDLPQVLKNILPHIRYPLIPVESLITFVKPLELIPEDAYMESLEYNTCPAEFLNVQSPQFTVRNTIFQGNTIMSPSQTKQLVKWLNKTKYKYKEWELCYKASKHGWQGRDFHTHCDLVGATGISPSSTNSLISSGRDKIHKRKHLWRFQPRIMELK